jgi:cold shock protein
MVRTGTIAAWRDQGFGFIAPHGSGPQIFVHLSALTPGVVSLPVGTPVNFQLGQDREGRTMARNVRIIGDVYE